jgi:uncharacterized protein YjdB
MNAPLRFVSSNPALVSVDAKTGKIKAAKKLNGKAIKKAQKAVTVNVTAENGKALAIKVIVAPKIVRLTKFTVKGMPKKNRLTVGKTANLKINLKQKKATTLKVTFKSSKKKVLFVDKAGKLTGLSEGIATVKIKVGKKTVKTKKITVVAPVTKITVPAKSVNLKKGKTLNLKPVCYNGTETIAAKLTYKSSKRSVVTVNKKGQIKAKKKGKAKITIKSGNGKKITVTVKVS